MKSYNNWLFCWLLLFATALTSCSRMNDLHDPYMKEGEIIYTGKVDSAKIFPGENRAMLRFYTSDPKAKNLLVNWNLRTESTQFTIPVKNASEPVDVIISPLEEGLVYFELFTMNGEMRNKSVPYNLEGTIYGNIFQQSLMNRNCTAIRNYLDQMITIQWSSADPKVTGCQIKYTNQSGETVFLTTPVEESVTVIYDMSEASTFIEYQTVFLPEPDAIDLFYTAYRQVPIAEEDVNITAQVLKNTDAPFAHTGVDMCPGLPSRIYEIADWKTNDEAAANGNVDTHATLLDGVLALWAYSPYTASNTIENGKLYQTVELEAGTYRFDAYLFGNTNAQGNPKAYVVAALGNDLPDLNDTEQSALAFTLVPPPPLPSGQNQQLFVEFVLTEKSTVSLGFVITCGATTQLFFRKVELWWLRSK